MSNLNNEYSGKNTAVWEKVLSKDEQVQEEFSISKKYIMFWGVTWSILAAILTLYAFGFAALFTIFYFFFYLKKANVYAYTNKRVLIHKGWLSTSLTSVDYPKITDVHVSEPFLQRVFTQSGSIAINTAGSGGEEVILKNVANPYKLKKLLDELKDTQ